MGKFDERENRILNNTNRILFEQIEQIIANNDINHADLEAIDKAIDIIKDIKTMCAMDEVGSYDDYSYYMDYDENPSKMMHTRSKWDDRTRTTWRDPMYMDSRVMHNRPMRHGDEHMDMSEEPDYSRTRTM